MPGKWIVLIEAAGDTDTGAIEHEHVARLLRALDGGLESGALHSSYRYALQVERAADGPAEALQEVLSRWEDAVRELALPSWNVVRTEVLTPEELERDLESQDGDSTTAGGGPPPAAGSGGDDPGHELIRRAFSDPLTGLLGREAFEHQVQAALARTIGERQVGVIYLDLDDFDGINERFGGATGDQILVAVAQRSATVLRPGDGVARFGGDGFAVLLEDITDDVAVAVAGRLLHLVRSPHTIDGQTISMSASVGVALNEPGDDPTTLVANAGAALAVAKQAGGGCHVVFRQGMARPDAARRFVATDALQDRLAHLLLTQEVALTANESDTVDLAARVVMRQICSHVGCALGHAYVWPTDTSGRPPASLWHMADDTNYRAFQEQTDRLLLVPGDELQAQVVAAGRPVWVADVAGYSGWRRQQSALAAGLQSAFAFPVLVGREVVAVLEFFLRSRSESTRSFLDVLAAIGTQLGRVVERQRAASALQRSAEELRVSEALLRDVLALARLGSWLYELPAGTGTWSDEMFSIYGLETGAPTPDLQWALACVHPADRARVEAAISRMRQSGGGASVEVRLVRPDGELRWHRVEGSSVRDGDGRVIAIRGTSHDITERKLAEGELRRAKNLYQRIVETAGEGIVTVDAEGVTTFANAQMAQILGYAANQLSGMPASAFLDDATFTAAVRRQRRRAGITEHYQTTLRASDGTAVPVLVSASPLFDDDGRFDGTLAMVTDVSAPRQAEEVLRVDTLGLPRDAGGAGDKRPAG